jgi:cytochrome-b5 reductase
MRKKKALDSLKNASRIKGSAQAYGIPGVPPQGEDCGVSQCRHVSLPCCDLVASLLLGPSLRYRFALPRPSDVLGLPIGQHISIGATLPDQPKEVVRSYTPISSDENAGHFDLLIKSYPTGNISKYMAGLRIGQPIRVKGPKGAMVYTPNMVRHFGMIAGGTGITPMLQVIRAIIRGRPSNGGNDTTEVDLIFANVTQEDILLREDLDQLAKEDPGFRVHYVLNNPPEGWSGGVGFVSPDMIKVLPDTP